MPSEHYNIGCYLLDRLVEVGCGHFFGVPGDYNLRFLDDVEAKDDLKWVGCANELNAAYAADGYARIRGIGALLTTYGVGELSALNGIAGAYAENVPVIHVVGGASTKAANTHSINHHTLGDGVYGNFAKMSEHISCSVASLDHENAKVEIDRVIQQVLYCKKPGFILLPADVANAPCDAPAAKLELRPFQCPDETVKRFTAEVAKMFSTAKSPAALIGYLCDRYDCNAAMQELVELAHIPYAHMLLGKASLNEGSPLSIGCYFGKPSHENTKRIIESADLLVQVGTKFHDFGTGLFTHTIDAARCINIQPFSSTVGDSMTFSDLPMAKAIAIVREIACGCAGNWPSQYERSILLPPRNGETFNATHFWNEVQDEIHEGDIVIADQGTCSSACTGIHLRKDCRFIVQCLWGSIGYTLPAAFGAQLAAPERRVLLFIGDGAAQMSAQELGSFVRYGLKPVIFVINNDGYLIERVIHGWEAKYNDIALWDWCTVMKGMAGPRQSQCDIVRLDKVQETASLLSNSPAQPEKLTFVEVMLGARERPVVSLAPW